MKNTKKVESLDATKFRFKEIHGSSNPFGILGILKDRTAVGDAHFINLKNTEYEPNGVRFSYYGSGNVDESAALVLNYGTYLFCVVRGSAFRDTFSSSEKIEMRYYEVTSL